jgi:hypothetical protein
MFIHGANDTKSNKNSTQLFKVLARNREESGDVKELVLKSDRVGIDLFRADAARLNGEITNFLRAQVDKYRGLYAWAERSSPLAE